jgi:hypothetical protein
MTRVPQALAIVDTGAATISVSLVARIGDRWRLLGSLAAPAGTPEPALLAVIAARARAADSELEALHELGTTALETIPRLVARSRPAGTIAVLGASRRAVGDLAAAARRTGWRVVPASTDTHDPREMTELAMDRDVQAVVIGAGDPPGPDERAALDDLAALGGSVARRRPELRVVLVGSIRGRRAWSEALGEEVPGDPARVIEVAGLGARHGAGGNMVRALEDLLADPADGRQRLRWAAESLADLLDRRIELVEVGFDGGARIVAEPGSGGAGPTSEAVVTAAAGFAPVEPDEAAVDAVLAWSTGSLDRHRMSDRLRDLRGRPWVDLTGDGARLRLAAATAALARLAALTPELDARSMADVTVISGGAFAMAPPAAIAIAVAATLRRPGVSQFAWDHARLLGPIGTIEDDAERLALLSDLVRDAVVPLGSVVVSGGLGSRRGSRSRDRARVGRLVLDAGAEARRRDLLAGELAFVDLPPGRRAEARFEFNDPVRFGRRTRNLSVAVTGGLAGLIVDLRDVPLRLPERRDRRRSVLTDWSAQSWPGDER